MLRRLEEFLGAHGAHYELIAHKEAVTAQEGAAWTCASVDIRNGNTARRANATRRAAAANTSSRRFASRAVTRSGREHLAHAVSRGRLRCALQPCSPIRGTKATS